MQSEKEWLNKLNIVDKVFVKDYTGIKLSTVERITPTRQLVVDGIRFKDACAGRSGSPIDRIYLIEATEDMIEAYAQKKFTKRVEQRVSSVRLTYGQAVSINELLGLKITEDEFKK